METAVEKFANSLDKSDQMAVLCILSHGGKGFVYGSDGKKVKVDQFINHLDNKACKAMIGRPKLILIQACQGCKLALYSHIP